MSREITVRTISQPDNLEELKTVIRSVESQSEGEVLVHCDYDRITFEHVVPVKTDAKRLDPRDTFPRDELGRFKKRT